jgi:hypothetical protein
MLVTHIQRSLTPRGRCPFAVNVIELFHPTTFFPVIFRSFVTNLIRIGQAMCPEPVMEVEDVDFVCGIHIEHLDPKIV